MMRHSLAAVVVSIIMTSTCSAMKSNLHHHLHVAPAVPLTLLLHSQTYQSMYTFPRDLLLLAPPPSRSRWTAVVTPRRTSSTLDAIGRAMVQGKGKIMRSAVAVIVVLLMMMMIMTHDVQHSPIRNTTLDTKIVDY